ncbi:MAG: hypothetical protein NC218_01705 [Acetobacter sp.]|nr:hypothetical protein [Acetobacter sp.]
MSLYFLCCTITDRRNCEVIILDNTQKTVELTDQEKIDLLEKELLDVEGTLMLAKDAESISREQAEKLAREASITALRMRIGCRKYFAELISVVAGQGASTITLNRDIAKEYYTMPVIDYTKIGKSQGCRCMYGKLMYNNSVFREDILSWLSSKGYKIKVTDEYILISWGD